MAKKQQTDITNTLQETILALKAKGAGLKKRNVYGSFAAMEDAVDINNIPEESKLYLKSFNLQYLFNTKFLLPGTILEIIGAPHVSKTTLTLKLLGEFMSGNKDIPALFVDTEGANKFLIKERILRTLSTDKVEANNIMSRIVKMDGHPQQETLDAIRDFYIGLREDMTSGGISKDVPIIVVIDTISKMVPKSEAGALGFGDGKDRGIGNSSNLEFSKSMQEWMRKCPDDLETYGVFLIVVSHQNAKVDMSGFKPSFISADSIEAYNLTKIGGRAINQSSLLQVTLTRKDSLKKGGEFIGYNVKMTAMKNSRGQDRRASFYTVKTSIPKDTADKYESSLFLNTGLGSLFAENKFKDVREKDKVYSSKLLGFSGLDMFEAGELLNADEAIKEEIGSKLHILGYTSEPLDEESVQLSSATTDLEESNTYSEVSVSDSGTVEEPTTRRSRGRPKIKID